MRGNKIEAGNGIEIVRGIMKMAKEHKVRNKKNIYINYLN